MTDEQDMKAKRGTRITLLVVFISLFLAALCYWFYMLYEINEIENKDDVALKALVDTGVILKNSMKQNAAFQGMVVAFLLIYSVDYIIFKNNYF